MDIILNIAPYCGLGKYDWGRSVGGCIPIWVGHRNYLITSICLSLIPMTVILVTSIWTCIFTRGFLRKNLRRHKNTLNAENLAVQKQIYSVRIKNLIGVFGALILCHAISWFPFLAVSGLGLFIGLKTIPRKVYASVFVLFLFSNVTAPIIQIYFRKDLRNFLTRSIQKVPGICSKKVSLVSRSSVSTVTGSNARRSMDEVSHSAIDGLSQTTDMPK